MTETKYICDRCKSEQLTGEQFWTVRVQVNTIHSAASAYDTGPSVQWCRACVENMGILPKHKDGGMVSPLPTIEEMIREIVREEVSHE